MRIGLADLSDRYDTLFCDVWGVVHDGVAAYPEAIEALRNWRARGKHVVLVSNAPVPRGPVLGVLARKNVPADAHDAVVTSGDVVRAELVSRAVRRVHHIGPPRDLPLYDGLAIERVPIAAAELAVATGLEHEGRETAADYAERLAALKARDLLLLPANPDRVVDVGGRALPCAGALGDAYEAIGGTVVWGGKPHPPIYALARAEAARLAGRPVEDARVLFVGDSVQTDLAGAAAEGFDALFILGGIHRLESEDAARAVIGPYARTVVATQPHLAW